MDTKELCPICGEGHVINHVDQVENEYKGHKAMVPLHYQVCDTCHSDFAGAGDGKRNKRAIMAFRRSVDGLLTSAEICALRAKYKLTQGQAAKLFGGGPVAFSKYENDDVSQSSAMDVLLRLVRRSPAAFWALVEERGMVGELTLTRVAEQPLSVSTTTTNVVAMADYRNDVQYRKVRSATLTYVPEEKAWK